MGKRITHPESANTLTKQLRWYLRNCGVSTYRLERETGIHNSTLSRFLRDERGLSLNNIDILGRYLRLRLIRGEN